MQLSKEQALESRYGTYSSACTVHIGSKVLALSHLILLLSSHAFSDAIATSKAAAVCHYVVKYLSLIWTGRAAQRCAAKTLGINWQSLLSAAGCGTSLPAACMEVCAHGQNTFLHASRCSLCITQPVASQQHFLVQRHSQANLSI